MLFRKKNKEFSDSGFDWLLVGLGNPGKEYEGTRHNAGFIAMAAVCKRFGCSVERLRFKSYLGECRMGDNRVLLLMPQTFMNLSGEAVRDVASFYKIPPERTIIMFDDISLPVGRLRIKRDGSDGGHNGMKNIIYLTGSDKFPRIKIGIGAKPRPDYDLKDWVLSRFRGEDLENITAGAENAAMAAECMITQSIDTAMNKFNNR